MALLKALHAAVAIGLVALVWLIYPGRLLAIGGLAGVCYVVAAAAAARHRPMALWIAFAFSVLALAFSAWGVYRYLDNGFDYLSGTFGGRGAVNWPAYLFLLVALGSMTAVVLHVAVWRTQLRAKPKT
jgi:hypothetical protein